MSPRGSAPMTSPTSASMNGYRFVVDDAEFLGELIRAAIVGERDEKDFVAILRTFVEAA